MTVTGTAHKTPLKGNLSLRYTFFPGKRERVLLTPLVTEGTASGDVAAIVRPSDRPGLLTKRDRLWPSVILYSITCSFPLGRHQNPAFWTLRWKTEAAGNFGRRDENCRNLREPGWYFSPGLDKIFATGLASPRRARRVSSAGGFLAPTIWRPPSVLGRLRLQALLDFAR